MNTQIKYELNVLGKHVRFFQGNQSLLVLTSHWHLIPGLLPAFEPSSQINLKRQQYLITYNAHRAHAHYRTCHLRTNPSQSHLAHLPVLLLCDLFYAVDDWLIRFRKFLVGSMFVFFCSRCGWSERTCEITGVKGAPRDDSNPVVIAVWNHFAFLDRQAKCNVSRVPFLGSTQWHELRLTSSR